MKTKTLLLLALAGTSLATACQKSFESAPAAKPSSAQEIIFGLNGVSDSGTVTKGATQVDNDNLGTLYVSAIAGSGFAFENAAFTKGEDGKWHGGKYWPASNPNYKFAASNMSMVGNTSAPSVSVTNTNTDVVVGYLASPNFQSENDLPLQHIFAQIGTVTMKAPEGFTVTNLKLSLRPILQGTYNLIHNTWNRGSAVNSDVYIMGSANSGEDIAEGGTKVSDDNDLWLLPGEYTLRASYTISKGSYSRSKTATAQVNLSQGYNNNIGLNNDEANIPEPDDCKEVVFVVTVTPWESQILTPSFTQSNN